MMPLVFGDCADFVRESESLLEIGKREGASNVVIVDDLPVRDFFEKVVEINTFECGRAAAAGNAVFGR